MNYFTLFGIPVSLKVEPTALQKTYYALSREHHPDNFTLSDPAAQTEAEEMSAKINEAKNVLSDPYRRLTYILKEKKIIEDDEKYTLSPMFLGEMMDINEQLMELEVEDDTSVLARLKEDILEKDAGLDKEVSSFFEQDELTLNEAEATVLKEYYYKKKYVRRIMERLV